jgi:phospholipase/carboxylesterase
MLKRIVLPVLFLCICLGAIAQNALQEGLSLKYLVQQPKVKTPHPPIIILLHGYGSNEADLFELKDQLPDNFLIVAARAPISIGANAFEWYESEKVNGVADGKQSDLKNSTAAIKKFITEIVKKYNADAMDVYLLGFSQGAMMSYETGLTAPELLKGIAPLSGRIMPSLKPQIKRNAALKKLKIFIGHGDADNRVPYKDAQAANEYLKGLGLSPVFHTYKGMQHSISEDEIKDLVQWLKS